MIITHRIALDPNDRQETLLRQHAGYARFAWNWGFGAWQRYMTASHLRPWRTPGRSSVLWRNCAVFSAGLPGLWNCMVRTVRASGVSVAMRSFGAGIFG